MNSPLPLHLQALRYERGRLEVLNQLLLPLELKYEAVTSSEEAWHAIRDMKVRGAPAIAIAAALGLAVEAYKRSKEFASPQHALQFLLEKLTYLKTSRPTAVNLFEAADRLGALMKSRAASLPSTPEGASTLLNAFMDEAEQMLSRDIKDNMNIGDVGANYILGLANKTAVKVVTHCNTGSLATAGFGTALGVIRALNKRGTLSHAFATETRPYNQGARLTAFELVYEKIPATLITDSMAAFLMQTHEIDCVVVGADRVVANGDTANKIGTYQLAIAAHHHGIPFFVAAPTTSIDTNLSTGKAIPIEQRPAEELTHIGGKRIAAEGIGVWNPGFDVTPAKIISGIITEKGMILKKEGETEFRVKEFLASHQE